MKLAFSTLGCPGWTWDEIFATAKDLQLNGIEIRGIENELYAPNIRQFAPDKLTVTLQKLQSAQLTLPMLASGSCLGLEGNPGSQMEDAKAYIDLAKSVGASFVRVMITSTPHPVDADLVQAKANYIALCDYAKGTGVRVLIETNGLLADSKVMAEFLSGCDAQTAGVLWDIHHPYRYFGEKPAETCRLLGNWIQYCHVKDSVMGENGVTYRMMGYGDVPVFDALSTLQAQGYTGFVSLEWVKRWCPDLEEPGIVFSHFTSYMRYLFTQLK